jgi:hypothetical protein
MNSMIAVFLTTWNRWNEFHNRRFPPYVKQLEWIPWSPFSLLRETAGMNSKVKMCLWTYFHLSQVKHGTSSSLLVYQPIPVLINATVSVCLERQVGVGEGSLIGFNDATYFFCFSEFSRVRISFHGLFLTSNAPDPHAGRKSLIICRPYLVCPAVFIAASNSSRQNLNMNTSSDTSSYHLVSLSSA